MFLLPHKVGDYTLHRKLGTGGVAESYLGTSGQGGQAADSAAGKPVVVRRILPFVLRDAGRLSAIDGRIRDLIGVRHPYLVHVLEHLVEGDDHFIVEEYVDGVTLEQVLNWCRQSGHQIPHNVFLNIATQICNGLEALHGRSGKGSATEHVLHYALKPSALFLTREGKVLVGSYGLARSPTSFPHGGVSAPVPARMEYLSPEQTHPDQKLTPASDIFSLGACLYEVLTLESLFRAESNLQTIHKVRRAEVTSHLLRVKERMPGLDKVLFRALSLNPRHRYQRAFVLREDLRGLMAGYSFASISEDTRAFLAPLLQGSVSSTAGLAGASQPGSGHGGGGYVAGIDSAPDSPEGGDAFDDSPATRIDPDPMATAAVAAQALAERVAKERADVPVGSSAEQTGTANAEKTEWTQTHEGSLPPLEALNRDVPPDSTAAYIAHGSSGGALATPPPSPPTLAPLEDPPARTAPAPGPSGDTPPFFAEAPRTSSPTLAPAPSPFAPPGLARSPVAFGTDGVAAGSLAANAAVHGGTEAADGELIPALEASEGAHDGVVPASSAFDPVVDAAPPPILTAVPLPPPEAAPPVVEAAPPVLAPPPPVLTPKRRSALDRAPPPGQVNKPPPPRKGAKGATPAPVAGGTLSPADGPAPPALSGPAPVPPSPAPPSTVPSAPVASAPPPMLSHSRPLAPPAPRPPRSAPAPDPVFDSPPPSSGGGIFTTALLGGLGLMLLCSGAVWLGYRSLMPDGLPERSAATVAPPAVEAPAAVPANSETARPEVPAPAAAVPDDPAAVLAGLDDPPATPTATAPSTPPVPVAAVPAPAPAPVKATPAAAPAAAPVASTPKASPSATAAPKATTTSTSKPTTSSTTTAKSTSTPPSKPPSTSSVSTSTAAAKAPTTSTPKTTPTSASTASKASAPTTATTSTTAALDVVEEATNLDAYVEAAKKGKLASSDVGLLELVEDTDPQYTRSRALLLMNAQKKGDDAGTKRYLEQIMQLPENQYNPVFLSDYARFYVNRGDYARALEMSQKAEKYWARLPSELVYSKKAEIYEIQAAAWQGKFYKSGEDLELLENAIRGWERFKAHVGTQARADLEKKADTELAKLSDIRSRLQ